MTTKKKSGDAPLIEALVKTIHGALYEKYGGILTVDYNDTCVMAYYASNYTNHIEGVLITPDENEKRCLVQYGEALNTHSPVYLGGVYDVNEEEEFELHSPTMLDDICYFVENNIHIRGNLIEILHMMKANNADDE